MEACLLSEEEDAVILVEESSGIRTYDTMNCTNFSNDEWIKLRDNNETLINTVLSLARYNYLDDLLEFSLCASAAMDLIERGSIFDTREAKYFWIDGTKKRR